MKKIAFIALMSSLLTVHANEPRCENGLWEGLSFMLFTGGENCDNRIVTCNFQGTRSEGWYSYDKDDGQLINRSPCNENESKPHCIEIENGKQAWVIGNRAPFIADCAEMDVVCSFKGTTEEGWYAYPSENRKIIIYAQCSNES